MADFDLLTPPYLIDAVAKPVLKYVKRKFGNTGLKVDQPFSDRVSWVPTIQVRGAGNELILVEVAELLYPQVFNTAYAGILNDEATRPIRVFQACPLESFQADKRHELVRKLKQHGFGLITVDDQQNVDVQFNASVLIHHIPQSKVDELLRQVSPDVKAAFLRSFDVYRTDENQGVQLAGQIVEALIHFLASKCHESGVLPKYRTSDTAASVIDGLYSSTHKTLIAQRACFGGARQFMKLERNASSHPSKSRKVADAKATTLRDGFLAALRVAAELCKARKALGLRGKIQL